MGKAPLTAEEKRERRKQRREQRMKDGHKPKKAPAAVRPRIVIQEDPEAKLLATKKMVAMQMELSQLRQRYAKLKGELEDPTTEVAVPLDMEEDLVIQVSILRELLGEMLSSSIKKQSVPYAAWNTLRSRAEKVLEQTEVTGKRFEKNRILQYVKKVLNEVQWWHIPEGTTAEALLAQVVEYLRDEIRIYQPRVKRRKTRRYRPDKYA